MLVEARLQEQNDNWEQFLIRNHVIEAPEQQETIGLKQNSIKNSLW
jgi:hypothetical protein